MKLRAFRKDQEGAATVDFVVIFPIFFLTIMTFFEAGWFMAKSAMLDRGMETAIRDLRVGVYSNPTPALIRQRVCAAAVIFDDCDNSLMVELTPINNSSDFPSDGADCVDRSLAVALRPKDDFTPGARSEVMFVRVCAVEDPLKPPVGLGLRLTSYRTVGGRMIAYSAFVIEPD